MTSIKEDDFDNKILPQPKKLRPLQSGAKFFWFNHFSLEYVAKQKVAGQNGMLAFGHLDRVMEKETTYVAAYKPGIQIKGRGC